VLLGEAKLVLVTGAPFLTLFDSENTNSAQRFFEEKGADFLAGREWEIQARSVLAPPTHARTYSFAENGIINEAP
jgi:hypothetical protein